MTQTLAPLTEFYFLRHGETDWNVEHRYQGSTDIPLNATGITQAQEAQKIITSLGIDLCVASPLQRAYKTAQIVTQEIGLDVLVDKRLGERLGGKIEGMVRDDVVADSRNNPHLYSGEMVGPWPLPKDAEAPEVTLNRLQEAINDHVFKQNDKKVLFVSHGGVIFYVLKVLNIDLPNGFRAPNAKPFRFFKQGQQWQFEVLEK